MLYPKKQEMMASSMSIKINNSYLNFLMEAAREDNNRRMLQFQGKKTLVFQYIHSYKESQPFLERSPTLTVLLCMTVRLFLYLLSPVIGAEDILISKNTKQNKTKQTFLLRHTIKTAKHNGNGPCFSAGAKYNRKELDPA